MKRQVLFCIQQSIRSDLIMPGPSPETGYPLAGYPRAIFLKNFITRQNVMVGDYTYYDDPDGAERFEEQNILYH
jgi:virginiamycin A acetyltransferase